MDFKPANGGVSISSSELSLQGQIGRNFAVIESPGNSPPHWAHYFDVRTLGFAGSRELAVGVQLDEVLMRHNEGEPFSAEDVDKKIYVSIAFGKFIMRRILFDPERDFFPLYSADFRGGSHSEMTGVVVEHPKTQTWVLPVKVGEHWMPERVRMLVESHMLIDIEFKWWGVNRDVPEDAFSISSSGLKSGTKLFDNRSVPPTETYVP